MDELAKLYLRLPTGSVYRVKVFANMVGIERQHPTHGHNLLISKSENRDAQHTYDPEASVWDFGHLMNLLSHYETELLSVQ